MMDFEDLLGYKNHFLNERHLEKDYLQTLLLDDIYSEFSDELVFKGGTALEKLYGLDRFSEDLDFTYNGEGIDDTKEKLIKMLHGIKGQYDFNIHVPPRAENALTIELRNMRGPLYQIRKRTHIIKLDFSLRFRTIFPPDLKYFTPIYSDIKSFSVFIMNLDEILAEKIVAILTRKKARDIYDVYYLLSRYKLILNKDLLNKKLEPYNISFTKKLLFERIDDIDENLWKEALSDLIKNLPEHNSVVSKIKWLI